MSRTVYCVKLEKEAPGLKFPPFPNELGKKIYENISQEAWDEWTRYQTILINENRLNLSDAAARKYLQRQMEHFFFAENPADNAL
ncbi:MAG: oxidative damage protection protein [Neisseriaceae bacterium]|nr:oxidative damage protection protein [Neisseriaceae bacterium]